MTPEQIIERVMDTVLAHSEAAYHYRRGDTNVGPEARALTATRRAVAQAVCDVLEEVPCAKVRFPNVECRAHHDSYERTQVLANTAFRAYACDRCKKLAAWQSLAKAAPDV